jgi:hypothetical protein
VPLTVDGGFIFFINRGTRHNFLLQARAVFVFFDRRFSKYLF